ncbi:hypothetical protein V6N12_009910 [Hibiscus sabdariffa]|uniref:Uncharacterized protein n=1 Tax=Hibiscus sabdariffa TaxID=183260 RepID=A0ABR2ECJ0_9ROSI
MHDTPILPPLTADQFASPGGRPPDGLPEVVLPQPMKDLAVVSFEGENRLREGVDMDMDETLATPGESARQEAVEDSSGGLVEGKESYASMAARNSGVLGKSSTSCGFSDDDIVVLEDDYVIDHSGAIPSIKFSDRVHEQNDKTMQN